MKIEPPAPETRSVMAINGAVLTRRISGSSRVLEVITAQLRQRGYTVIVIQPVFRGSLPAVLRFARWLLWDTVVFPWRARRANILVCPTNVAPIVRFSRKQKVVTFIHDTLVLDLDTFNPLYALNARITFRIGAKCSDHIIAPSHYSKARIIERLRPSCPVTVVPYGVEDDWFVGPKSPPERLRLIAVGAAEEHKRLPLVVRFATQLADRFGHGLELVLVSVKGRDDPHLLEATEFARAAGVTVARRAGIANLELRNLMRTASLLLQFSIAEGFGLPVVEAAASGTPVAHLEGGALPELLGDACLHNRDTDVLLDQCEALLKNQREYQRLSTAGYERSLIFSADAFGDRLLKVLVGQDEPSWEVIGAKEQLRGDGLAAPRGTRHPDE